MLCVLPYSHVVKRMYVCGRETACWCVCLCCCSANERQGVSGFQVLMLWERRWVTGLMNSDVRQLLINQETVCQPADWNSSPSPMCTHTCAHKHTHTQKNTHIHEPLQMFSRPHLHTHAVEFIFPSYVSPVLRVELRPILPFPPDTWVQCAHYLCAHTAPTGAKPSLNMEISARCKFWMRPRAQKVPKIKAKAVPTVEVILTF